MYREEITCEKCGSTIIPATLQMERDEARVKCEKQAQVIGQLVKDNNLWQAKWLGQKQRADEAELRVNAAEKERDFFDVERMKVVEQLTQAESEVAALREELEGDNGLRAHTANSRLQLLEKLRAELELGTEVDRLDAELKKERDRRVEHRQMNQSLNEQVQRLQAANAELQRKNDNQAAALGLPRAQDAAEIHELKQSLATARGLLCEWVNFDFDCPHEEYDEENDCYDEDGTALSKLYEDTRSFLWCAKSSTERKLCPRAKP